MLGPLVEKTLFHIKKLQRFHRVLLKEDCFCLHDVVSVTPIPRALEVIKQRLFRDNTLKKHTKLEVDYVIEFLDNSTITYFIFQGEICKQRFGTTMGSPVSSIGANLYMEYLEQEALTSALVKHKSKYWKRYVNGMLEIIKKGMEEMLINHLNTVDDTGCITFMHKKEDKWSLPFLDTL